MIQICGNINIPFSNPQLNQKIKKKYNSGPCRRMDAKALLTKHGLLRSEQLYQYLLETSVYPREPLVLKELRAATQSHPLSFMGTAPDEGQFLSLLLQTMNAKKTIEIGVYTGYSLLLTALAIPEDGMITAIDIDQEAYNVGLPFIRKAGVENKINFINSDAHLVLDQLLEDHKNHGSFDFAFVDADKSSYGKYHEKILKLLKVGGMVVYDNTMWAGTVAMPEETVPKEFGVREIRRVIMEFNKFIASDTRVQISQAPLGDGITICRRLQ